MQDGRKSLCLILDITKMCILPSGDVPNTVHTTKNKVDPDWDCQEDVQLCKVGGLCKVVQFAGEGSVIHSGCQKVT